ncbi:unnamed protein product (macronuclear) [Paramecium tetraurelia]|uniref:Uncharacterized protein n=1 Tax=Paramecium tetraurelia TaxID=5888 RepID=A0EBV2_PARTE|nr:uncharacterized protein GSPATT00025504001 [Paramecium tetraurelia]CAK92769.1 unnamed protein product [Paramecium tetraurelia]|eukprot:XP_001460166.1 hypothetical protein (macronuclear) [Paramecium tetraurelia strain d4-2]
MDQQAKDLILQNLQLIQDSNLFSIFRSQIEVSATLQQQFKETKRIIEQSDILQIIHQIDQIQNSIATNIEIINKDENIVQYIAQNKKIIIQMITNKYEQTIINTLNSLGFPDPSNEPEIIQFKQLQELTIYSKLIKHVSQFEPRFLSSIFVKLNQNFDYHFIDSIQATSNINNSSWFFNYLYENFEKSIKQLFKLDPNYEEQIQNYQNFELEEIIQTFASLMIQHYIIYNITKRVKRDKDEFIFQPNLALLFFEELDNFCQSIEQFWYICFDQKCNQIFEVILLILNESNIFGKILEWEIQLFNQSIFNEYENKIQQKNIHLFLNFVEEFQIVWNSQYQKYSLIVNQNLIDQVQQIYSLIFKQFLELCEQYYLIIKQIESKDYVQFLQTYYLGLKALKQQFKKYKTSIKQLKQNTLIKFLEPISNQCSEEIYQKLFKEYLYDDKLTAEFFKSISKVNFYQNHQIIFLQSQHEFAKKINNFYYKANSIINQIINTNLIERQYIADLASKVISIIISQLTTKTHKFIVKQEYSQDGILIMFLVILRTTFLVLYSSINHQKNTKAQKKINEKFEQIQTIINNRYILNEQSWQKVIKSYPLLTQKDVEILKNLKINQTT